MNEAIIRADIAIVGAGMAGASLAAEIGDAAKVVLIEAEPHPGYHSTGRSAAFWSETYGGPAVRPLTTASHDYLSAHGFLGARGAIHLADATGLAALDALVRDHGSAVPLERLSEDGVARRIGGLRGPVLGALAEPGCSDIDVAGLHAHYLARATRTGTRLLLDARVTAVERVRAEWRLAAGGVIVVAPTVVNAAGAWASELAEVAGASPIAITPCRRTVIQLEIDPPAPATMPLVIDAAGRFYFKPDVGGRIWLSPHDETPSPPCDAAADELDVAIAIDRLEQLVDWRIIRRERAWAGLRSFAPDRAPVYGWDTRATGFYWCAGQGGFGIQTAPAAAMIGAASLLQRELPEAVRHIDIAAYEPSRFS